MTDHATRAREKLVGELVDKFLAWPLPNSVCADLCATKQGYPHRSGTTLLNATEAKQMVEHLFTDFIAAALAQAAQEARSRIAELEAEQICEGNEYRKFAQEIAPPGTPLATDGMISFGKLREVVEAAIAQAAQPVWSTEKPTVAGWYWWRNKQLKYEEDMEPRIVEVRLYAGDLAIGNCRLAQSSFLKGEWAGPLPLPREA